VTAKRKIGRRGVRRDALGNQRVECHNGTEIKTWECNQCRRRRPVRPLGRHEQIFGDILRFFGDWRAVQLLGENRFLKYKVDHDVGSGGHRQEKSAPAQRDKNTAGRMERRPATWLHQPGNIDRKAWSVNLD
jgi:hypothetical protein